MMAESQNRHDKASLGVLPFMLLAALVLINYAGTLRADFIYDDGDQLVENYSLRDLRNIPRFFTDPAHTSSSLIIEEIYRPLRATVFALEYQLWGLNPVGFHAVNIAFHMLNSFLVFLFLRRLFRSQLPAVAGSLIFASHPALTESVCWISGRSDLLCMFFYLTAFLWYLKSREAAGRRRAAFLVGSAAALVLALLSKEMAVTFVLAILVADIWMEGFKGQDSRRWLGYLPFAAITLAYLLIRANIMGQFAQRGLWGGTVPATAALMAKGLTYYVRLLLFPFRLTVVPLIAPNTSPLNTETVLCAMLIIGLITAALLLRHRYPLPSLGVIIFFVLLLPVSNIIPIKAVVGDRFVYIPSLGYLLVLTGLFSFVESPEARPSAALKALAVGSLIAIVFFFSINTIARSVDWHDNLSLMESAVKVDPENFRANVLAGKQHFMMGDYESAEKYCLTAVRANPASSESHALLSSIYLKKGFHEEAISEARMALGLNPGSSETYNTLGLIYMEQGKLDEAQSAFEEARRLAPYGPEILNNLGAVLLKKGEIKQAAGCFAEALRIRPDYSEATYNMALAFLRLKRYSEAVSLFEKLVAESPGDPKLLTLMGDALSGMDRQEAAINSYRAAITAQPSYTPAHTHLAELLVETGEYEQAISIYQSILALYPAAARQRMGLISALEKTGRLNEAIEEVRIAVRLNPQDASVRYKLAALLKRIGNESEAKMEYEIAEQLKSSAAANNNQTVR